VAAQHGATASPLGAADPANTLEMQVLAPPALPAALMLSQPASAALTSGGALHLISAAGIAPALLKRGRLDDVTVAAVSKPASAEERREQRRAEGRKAGAYSVTGQRLRGRERPPGALLDKLFRRRQGGGGGVISCSVVQPLMTDSLTAGSVVKE